MSKSHRGAAIRAAVVTTSAAVAAVIAALPATTSAPAAEPATPAILAAPIPRPFAAPAPAPVPVAATASAEAPAAVRAEAAGKRRTAEKAAAEEKEVEKAQRRKVETKAAVTEAAASSSASSAAATALEHALDQKGDPYRWGATGPDAFDCSGLVVYAFEKAGVDLPRTSRAQSKVGEKVSKDELRPGDLVFFYSPVSHVGVYMGDGKIVHASSSGRPVKVSDMGGMEFNSARRV